MKKLFGLLTAFLLFMCAIVVALILMPPASWAKYLVIKGVRDTSGLDIKINGRLSLRLVPTINLQMEDVVVTNPATPAARPVLTARAVEVRSGIRPLLQEEHRVEHVLLTDPRIDIEIAKDGRASWQGPATTRSGGAAAPRGTFLIQTLEASGANVGFRDQRSASATLIEGARITAREVTPDRITEAVLEAAAVSYDEATVGALELGQMSATASEFQAGRVRELTGAGATLRWRQPGQASAISVAAEKYTLKAQSVGLEGTGPLSVTGGSVRWRDPASGASLAATEFAGTARTFKPGRAEDVVMKSAGLAYSTATRAAPSGAKSAAPAGGPGSGPTILNDVSFATPLLATGAPVDGAVGLVWNKERVTGQVKLPAPELLASSPTLPATVSLAAAGGNLDFSGTIATGDSPTAKGQAKASASSLEAIGRWLGAPLPASMRGNASMTGDVEATPRRIALANGRIEHAGNAMTGAVTVDIGSTRPLVAGRLAADKFNADRYVGQAPAKRTSPGETVKITPPVPVNDALKLQLRAMLDAQPRRGGGLEGAEVDFAQLAPRRSSAKREADGFEWSEEKFDLSGLRGFDLDLDLSFKELSIRGYQVVVPRLKTLLKDGTLAVEGNDLVARSAKVGGKLSGKAEIDARQPTPTISTNFKADGIDVEDVAEAFGIPVMLGGVTALEGNLTSTGRSQKELVEGLSGRLRSRMGQGQVIGYDFSSVLSWVFGNREYDPSKRTPITRLAADLNFDMGIARESQVELDGPIIGANAEGSMRLIDQEIDYRAKLRLSAWFRAISLRIFGDWSQPSIAPDLGSVFTRGGPGGDGSLADALAGVDANDPELAELIGRVLERAGPAQRGLDPLVGGALKALQERIGKPR